MYAASAAGAAGAVAELFSGAVLIKRGLMSGVLGHVIHNAINNKHHQQSAHTGYHVISRPQGGGGRVPRTRQAGLKFRSFSYLTWSERS